MTWSIDTEKRKQQQQQQTTTRQGELEFVSAGPLTPMIDLVLHCFRFRKRTYPLELKREKTTSAVVAVLLLCCCLHGFV